jgi:ABC-type polysaccharide/polyol phosphate transport system ATPase subunit
MSNIDLEFNHVSKRYRVWQQDAGLTTQNALLRRLQSLRKRAQDFWAVKDVSFAVPRGEALGIIGHNGAGKSTILKLLSNITSPTSGEITIQGRLSALIEVGSGFHPELSGRENVYLSGSILGMRRREITKKLDSIIEFAELRQFIDTPVKRYSSGMYVRLGFSIAAHLDPDILLLDEVLAVGDAAFQSKCLQRIMELKQAGKTIVFISHDLTAVERLCDRVLLMQRGELIKTGPTREVISEYQQATTSFVPSAPPSREIESLPRWARITNLAFRDAAGVEAVSFCSGEPLSVRVEYTADEPVADAVFEVFFYSQDGQLRCQLTTELSGDRIDLERGTGAIEFSCPELSLLPGAYTVDLTIANRGALAGTAIDWQFRCATLCVEKGKTVRGDFYMPHHWQFRREEKDATRDNSHTERTLGELASKV